MGWLKRQDGREPTNGWGQVHDGRHGQWCAECNSWRHAHAEEDETVSEQGERS